MSEQKQDEPNKIEVVNYLKENLGIKSFSEGFKNRNFNIFVEKKQ